MCVVRVETRVHPDGKRDVIEERRYCASTIPGQLCDRVDRWELSTERIAINETRSGRSILSRRSIADQPYKVRPRTVLFEDTIPINPRLPLTPRRSEMRNTRRSITLHDAPRRRRDDHADVYEVLPEAPSPPRYTMKSSLSRTAYTRTSLRDDSLQVYVLESHPRSYLEHSPVLPASMPQPSSTASNRNSRIDSAYAPSEHAKSPSPPRSRDHDLSYRPRRREEEYIDDQLPQRRVTRYAYSKNAAARLDDIGSDYDRAQKDTERMSDALRYMSISGGQASGETSPSRPKKDKKHRSRDSGSKSGRSLKD